jgi:hypothetical protein
MGFCGELLNLRDMKQQRDGENYTMGNFIILTNNIMVKSKIEKACSVRGRREKRSKFLSENLNKNTVWETLV